MELRIGNFLWCFKKNSRYRHRKYNELHLLSWNLQISNVEVVKLNKFVN